MKKKKKSQLEEYHSGKTTDLRNIIAEIKKVDQETADLSAVVEEAQRIDRKNKNVRKNVFTCRLLGSSILDKVFLFLLLIGFAIATFMNFNGNLFSATYGFWIRVVYEMEIVVLFLVACFLFNWIYKCIIKTMLCITPNSIYREIHFPFWKKETSIPISHVTAISTFSLFWVIRGVIIHQYSGFPMIFLTWNHQLFKSRVDELLHNDSIDYNGASGRTIFRRKYYPLIRWTFLLLAFIIIVVGIIHFFGYIFSKEKEISGTYLKGNQKISLKVNGNCSLRLVSVKNLAKCKWDYNEDEHTIRIRYAYRKKDYFGEYHDKKDTITVGYKDHLLIYNGVEYKKK